MEREYTRRVVVRIKKAADGAILAVVRADGEATWQRSRMGGFFALHDLTHLVVESVLGFDDAFFGLLAKGWDIRTFEDKADPRYAEIPDRAILTEHIVGILLGRATDPARPNDTRHDADLRQTWADEINAELAMCLAKDELAPFTIAPDTLNQIIEKLEPLHASWASLLVGSTLELTFPLGDPP